jgi:large subunit ribosomal protein L4
MEFPVYRQDGSEAGRSVTLSDAVFGIEPNDHVIWLDVKATQANARQGTHKAREKSENSHSTRKLYRQKGTGSARAGSAKSPIRRGGGTIFGPRPRDYSQRINRKTKQLATRSALAYKAQEGAIRIVDAIALEAPRTREINSLVRTLGLSGRTLVVADTVGRELLLSIRNLPAVHLRSAQDVSTLDVMQATTVVFLEGALSILDDRFSSAKETSSGDGAVVAAEPVIDVPTSEPVVSQQPVIDTPTAAVVDAEPSPVDTTSSPDTAAEVGERLARAESAESDAADGVVQNPVDASDAGIEKAGGKGDSSLDAATA